MGTPGRLADLLTRRQLDPSGVAAAVLDEADELLEGGFGADVGRLLAALPAGARRHLFSATVTPVLQRVAERLLADPLGVTVQPLDGATRARLRALLVHARDRHAVIPGLVRSHAARGGVLVFCARRAGAGDLAAWLGGEGLGAVVLTGALAPAERRAALAALRSGRAQVCVATDLAARGLVIPGLSLVIHGDLPGSATALVHRNGRRGRGGMVVMLVARGERRRAERLADRAGVALDWED